MDGDFPHGCSQLNHGLKAKDNISNFFSHLIIEEYKNKYITMTASNTHGSSYCFTVGFHETVIYFT